MRSVMQEARLRASCQRASDDAAARAAWLAEVSDEDLSALQQKALGAAPGPLIREIWQKADPRRCPGLIVTMMRLHGYRPATGEGRLPFKE